MKMKSVTFEDYAKVRLGNEDKTYSQIIDIAWKNSKEGIRAKTIRKNTIKALSLGCFTFVICGLFFNPTTRAFADVLGMEALAREERHLFEDLKYVCEFYKDCIGILGIEQSVPLFMDIAKESFTESQLGYLIESAKFLSLDEILQLVATL